MTLNPYEPPHERNEPAVDPPRKRQTDWLALAGVFVGAMAAAYLGYWLSRWGAEGRVVLLSIFGVVAGASLVGWIAGRVVQRHG